MTAEAELMPIPLWHGTSSWFLPGILEHGLGAVDVHAQLRSREFYRAVWELRLQLAPPEEQQKLQQGYGYHARAIIDDVTPGGLNYRYGSIYCFGMAGRAVSFAARGYGSEMIRFGAAWWEEIREIAPDAADVLLTEFPEMAACLAHDHQPVVIRLDSIELRHVRLDNGRAIPPGLLSGLEGLPFELTELSDRASVTAFRAENVELGFAHAESFDLIPVEAPPP